MKFETKFGIGEIVIHRTNEKAKDSFKEEIEIEIVGISFGGKQKKIVQYHCRYPSGIVVYFLENELIGDPGFDQDVGCYPDD